MSTVCRWVLTVAAVALVWFALVAPVEGKALTPLAFYEVVMNEAFGRLVDGEVDVSVDTGLRAAEKLQALVDARAGEADVVSLRVEVGRIIEVVRTFIPSERWPEVQAALRGDPPPYNASSSLLLRKVSAWWPSTTPPMRTARERRQSSWKCPIAYPVRTGGRDWRRVG